MKRKAGRPITSVKFSGRGGSGTPLEVGHAFWVLMQRPEMTYAKALDIVGWANAKPNGKPLSKPTIDKYRKQYKAEVLDAAAATGITPHQQFDKLTRGK